MRKIIKKMLGVTLSTTTVLTSFAPLTVLANSPYTVTFTFADGYIGTTENGDGSNFVINGTNYTELRTNKDNGSSRVGSANCSNDTCTITVEDGTPTYLISGPFTFKQGDEVFDINSPISSNITLHVEAQQQNQQQPQQPINNNYNVTFNGTVSGGNVTYTIGDATVTVSVTGKSIPANKTLEVSAIDTITLSGFDADTMQVRVSDNDPSQQNPFGMNLTVDNNVVHIVNPNGGMPPSLDFVVEAKNNNNNNNNNNNDPQQPQQPGTGDHFDGKAYILWSCKGGGICMKHFNDIPNFDDGNSKFYKDTDIVDERTGEHFDINAKYKGWSTDQLFNNWVDAYKSAKGITGDINWANVNPKDMLGDPIDVRQYEDASGCTKEGKVQEEYEACVNEYAASQGVLVARAQLKPVGEPQHKNAYVSYGDRNFKTVIYNSKYKGISIGDLSDLNYYPAEWANPYLRRDQYDISETTKAKPTGIGTILLEKMINIKEIDANGFKIAKLEALDVPSDAVKIEKVNGEWRLTFSSNFYDNVVFKVTDTDGEVSYFQINRYTVDAWINNVEGKPHLYAEMYFDKNKSYTDFTLTAKIEYKDGTTEKVKLTPYDKIDDGLGNFTEGYEVDESNPKDPNVPRGKGLKKSVFIYKLKNGKTDRDVKKAYINVEYKGSTADTYAGAYAGSGKGILANIYQGEGE